MENTLNWWVFDEYHQELIREKIAIIKDIDSVNSDGTMNDDDRSDLLCDLAERIVSIDEALARYDYED